MTATLRPSLVPVGIALILGLVLASCGGSSKRAVSVTTSASETGPAPARSRRRRAGRQDADQWRGARCTTTG